MRRPPTPDALLHALLAPTVVNVFQVLDVAITLWQPTRWSEIYERSYESDIIGFELEHGVEAERVRYNIRCLAEARRTGRTVRAEHLGLSDLFVPVGVAGKVDAVLVTGPFARARVTTAGLLERWRSLTGRQGDPADPEFAYFVSVMLGTVTFDGDKSAAFQRLVELLAKLIAQSEPPQRLIAEVRAIGAKLSEARLAERTWTIAQALIDPRTSRAWSSPQRAPRLWAIGVKQTPEQVMVGLFVGKKAGIDPVEELLRCDAFQRACVEIARRAGGASGRVGHRGLTLLSPSLGSEQRTRRQLIDLSHQVSRIAAHRFGLSVHFGMAHKGTLPEQFRSALAAAETAFSKGTLVEKAGEHSTGGVVSGNRLEARYERDGSTLASRFDRFLEGVTVRSGQNIDVARAYVEMGFDRVVEGARADGIIEERSLVEMRLRLERAAAEASTLGELFSAYRYAVQDIARALAQPRGALRDRSLRRAEEFIRRHHGEPLSLARAAHVAGFAPKYFSRLFRERQGVTFERFLTQLRIERARQLLSGAAAFGEDLTLERVAQLSGFASRQYLGRLFKRHTGEAPAAFRKRVRTEIRKISTVTPP